MMALAAKSPMESTSSLGGGFGYGVGRSKWDMSTNGIGEDDLMGLNLGALETRIGKEMPGGEGLSWEDVDEVLAKAGEKGPGDEPVLETRDELDNDMESTMKEENVQVDRHEVQVDTQGNIVSSQQETAVKMEPVPLHSPPETHDRPLKKEENVAVSIQARQPSNPTADVAQHRGDESPASRKVSLKEKRELEAKMFPRELLRNLEGTTSAEVRKMNSTERDLVLFKRKLRNRESARRSRVKRQATLAELQAEVDNISECVEKILISAIGLKNDNDMLNRKLEVANAELRAWRSVYPGAKPMSHQPVKVGG